jgi:ankyrin repeat protein
MFKTLARILKERGSNAHWLLEARILQDVEGFSDVVNRKTMSKGYTLLTYAVCNRLNKCAKVLLKYGADPNTLDREQRFALVYADTDVMEAMVKFDLTLSDENIGILFAKNNDDLAASVVARGINVDNTIVITETARTLLTYAAEEGLVETVRALLTACADVNVPDASGNTALSLVYDFEGPRHDEIVEMLEFCGALKFDDGEQ